MAKKKAKPSEADGTTEVRFVGRPRSIATAAELEERILGYLNSLGRYGLPCKAGLSFACGMSRDTLNKYEKEEPYSDVLKHWYCLFESMWVQNLSRPNATGSIFYLKNTYGFMDAFDHTSGGKPVSYVIPNEIAQKHRLVLDIKKEPEPIKAQESAPKA